MTRDEILAKLTIIARDVFDNNDVVFTEDTSAADIEEWDSLNHIQFVVAIEKQFNVSFGAKEIQSWGKVGDVINSLQK